MATYLSGYGKHKLTRLLSKTLYLSTIISTTAFSEEATESDNNISFSKNCAEDEKPAEKDSTLENASTKNANTEMQNEEADNENEEEAPFSGSFWLNAYSHHNAYFSSTADHNWIEATLFLKGHQKFGKHVFARESLALSTTLGKDYFYYDGASILDDSSSMKSYRYNIQPNVFQIGLSGLIGGKFEISIGRQEISYGSGFILADGYSEFGDLIARQEHFFETNSDNAFGGTGQWAIPVKSWDALRATYKTGNYSVDGMFSRLNPSRLPIPQNEWKVAFPGYVLALDFGHSKDDTDSGITWVTRGIFKDNDNSIPKSTISTLSVRRKQDLFNNAFNVDLEIAGQIGKSDSVNQLGWGGRFEISRYFDDELLKPTLKAGVYVFSGDNPETETNESYDPMFYDWASFGRWYFGDIIGNQWLSNTNLLATNATIEIKPTDSQSLSTQFYYFKTLKHVPTCSDNENCDKSSFALELDVIWSWVPKKIGPWNTDEALTFGLVADVAQPLGHMRSIHQAASFAGFAYLTMDF